MAYGSIDAERLDESVSVRRSRFSSLGVVAIIGTALAVLLVFSVRYSAAPVITPNGAVVNTIARAAAGNDSTANLTSVDATPATDFGGPRDRSLYARKLAQMLEAPIDQPESRVDVGVYYETGCPYCQEFLSKDLWEVWTAEGVPNIINLLLVPYGNTKETNDNGTVTFKCQHGIDECKANMLQTCAIAMYPTANVVPFVRCMAQEKNYVAATERCAKENQIDFGALNDCVNTNGTRYYHMMGLLTRNLSPKMQGTPWITINGFPLEAGDNVLRIVCKMATGMGPLPAGCVSLPPRENRCWKSAAMVEENSPTITL